VTGQGGDGPVELTPEQTAQVLADVRRRREIADEAAKALPQESALDLIRRRGRERRAARAEDAGQLDFGGDGG
jgi:hypothetical protein